MLLVPNITLQPFEKWAVDLIGLVNPVAKRSRELRYIITVIDYLTGWIEVEPVKDCSAEIVL